MRRGRGRTWDLVVVGTAQAVILGITIEEHAELQEWIWAIFDAWYHRAWREGGLFDIAVEVLWVLGEAQLAKLLHLRLWSVTLLLARVVAYWELPSGPDLCHVERIEAKYRRIGLLWLHDLHVSRVGDLFAFLDGLPEVLLRIVGVDATHLNCLLAGELLLATVGEEMVLDINELALGVDPACVSTEVECRFFDLPLEGMASVAMIMPPAIWSAMVAEEHHASMIAFGSVRQQVKRRIVVQQKVVWSASLRSNNIRPLNRIAAEKDREVQTNHIIVALACVELDGEPPGVSCQIRELASQSDRRVAKKDGSFRAGALEEVCFREMRHVLGGLKVTEGATATGVHHPLEEFVSVERLLLLKEEDIRSKWQSADGLTVIWRRPRDTIVVGVVRAIINALAALDNPGDLRSSHGGSFIGALEQ